MIGCDSKRGDVTLQEINGEVYLLICLGNGKWSKKKLPKNNKGDSK
tara:strand:+ start:2514 stop:2651 length:138 start_codon:yes stop_codon:yes gene_type:complete